MDCKAEAMHEHADKSGQVWAKLCPAHHDELECAVMPISGPAILLRAWINAQGGPAAAARRMRRAWP